MKTFTHTTYAQFGGSKLPPIPKSVTEQKELLEYAVYELMGWLMDELGWDNPGDIADRLADEVNKIAHKSFDKWSKIEHSS